GRTTVLDFRSSFFLLMLTLSSACQRPRQG
ncbi:MAG: hypothetical protein ACI9U2_004857, partial [Bradymonadia bacterium]